MHFIKELRRCNGDERAFILSALFLIMAFQASYFIGIIGQATFSLSAGPGLVSLLTLSYNASMLAGSVVAGIAIDRVGPRQTLICSLVAGIVCSLATWLLPPSAALLMGSSLALGAVWAFAGGTLSAFAPYLTNDQGRLKQVNSLVDSISGAASVLGPGLGGLVASLSSASAVFALMGLALLASLAFALQSHERIRSHVERRQGPSAAGDGVREFAEGLRTVLSSHELRLILAICFLGYFAFGAFDSLESVFYRDVLALDEAWMGWLSMIGGVGCMLGSMALLRIPKERLSLLLLAATLLLEGLGCLLYVGTDQLWCAVLGQLVVGLGSGMSMPVHHTLVQSRCDIGQIGRVSSVIRIGIMSSGVIPLLAAPALADAFGARGVLMGASLMVTLVACGFVLRLRGTKASRAGRA